MVTPALCSDFVTCCCVLLATRSYREPLSIKQFGNRLEQLNSSMIDIVAAPRDTLAGKHLRRAAPGVPCGMDTFRRQGASVLCGTGPNRLWTASA